MINQIEYSPIMSITEYESWTTYQEKKQSKIYFSIEILKQISDRASLVSQIKMTATCKELYKNMNLHLSNMKGCLLGDLYKKIWLQY